MKLDRGKIPLESKTHLSRTRKSWPGLAVLDLHLRSFISRDLGSGTDQRLVVASSQVHRDKDHGLMNLIENDQDLCAESWADSQNLSRTQSTSGVLSQTPAVQLQHGTTPAADPCRVVKGTSRSLARFEGCAFG